ncbi:MAG: ABC transporter ATP-binding protein [Roseiflexaceae bacterium]
MSNPAESREFRVSGAHEYDYRSPLRWLLSHVLRYPWLPLAVLAGYAGSSTLLSLTSLLIGRIFDTVGAGGVTAGALLGLALTVLAVRGAQGLVNLGATFSVETLAHRLERDVRDELYLNLLGKSQTFHNRQKSGDVMARATGDVQQLNAMFNPGLRLIIEASLSAVVPLVLIATLRLELLIVPLGFMVAFALALRHFNRRIGPIAGSQRWRFGMLNSQVAEVISGIEVVKAYAQEEQELGRFHQHADQYRDLSVKQGRAQAAYLPLLVYGVAFGLAFGHALLLLAAGALSVGQVIAFMGLVMQLRLVTMISGYSFMLIQFGMAGAKRLLELIQAESELDENVDGYAAPIQGAISFEQVSFAYGENPTLKQISFQVQPGETVAIVGQTGSGKSTLTKLINRTYDVGAGRVLVDGVDLRDWSLERLRGQIATIEQEVFLFSRSIAENIAFGAAGATPQQIEAAARIAQAHDFIMGFPDGYDTRVGERGVTLSGGQRQRIALARAFLTDPAILLVDDSTSAVDSATEDQILRAMHAVKANRTTVLITNRLSQIRWADRILVLRDGELIAQGTHEELLAGCATYQLLFAHYGRPALATEAQEWEVAVRG